MEWIYTTSSRVTSLQHRAWALKNYFAFFTVFCRLRGNGAQAEVRGQFSAVSSLFPSLGGVWGLNSRHQIYAANVFIHWVTSPTPGFYQMNKNICLIYLSSLSYLEQTPSKVREHVWSIGAGRHATLKGAEAWNSIFILPSDLPTPVSQNRENEPIPLTLFCVHIYHYYTDQ